MAADFTQPAQTEISLWRWSIMTETAVAQRLVNLLSQEEKAAYDRFSRADLACRYAAGRGGLRLVLGALLNTKPESIGFTYQAAGKPVLAEDTSLHFNLAHSAGKALLAVAREPVGVDLERHRRVNNQTELANRWFSSKETAQIRSVEEAERELLFFELWTGKEAVIKLLGASVGDLLREIEPPINTEQAKTFLPQPNLMDLEHCWVTRVPHDRGWSAAVACAKRLQLTLPCRIVDLAELLN